MKANIMKKILVYVLVLVCATGIFADEEMTAARFINLEPAQQEAYLLENPAYIGNLVVGYQESTFERASNAAVQASWDYVQDQRRLLTFSGQFNENIWNKLTEQQQFEFIQSNPDMFPELKPEDQAEIIRNPDAENVDLQNLMRLFDEMSTQDRRNLYAQLDDSEIVALYAVTPSDMAGSESLLEDIKHLAGRFNNEPVMVAGSFGSGAQYNPNEFVKALRLNPTTNELLEEAMTEESFQSSNPLFTQAFMYERTSGVFVEEDVFQGGDRLIYRRAEDGSFALQNEDGSLNIVLNENSGAPGVDGGDLHAISKSQSLFGFGTTSYDLDSGTGRKSVTKGDQVYLGKAPAPQDLGGGGENNGDNGQNAVIEVNSQGTATTEDEGQDDGGSSSEEESSTGETFVRTEQTSGDDETLDSEGDTPEQIESGGDASGDATDITRDEGSESRDVIPDSSPRNNQQNNDWLNDFDAETGIYTDPSDNTQYGFDGEDWVARPSDDLDWVHGNNPVMWNGRYWEATGNDDLPYVWDGDVWTIAGPENLVKEEPRNIPIERGNAVEGREGGSDGIITQDEDRSRNDQESNAEEANELERSEGRSELAQQETDDREQRDVEQETEQEQQPDQTTTEQAEQTTGGRIVSVTNPDTGEEEEIYLLPTINVPARKGETQPQNVEQYSRDLDRQFNELSEREDRYNRLLPGLSESERNEMQSQLDAVQRQLENVRQQQDALRSYTEAEDYSPGTIPAHIQQMLDEHNERQERLAREMAEREASQDTETTEQREQAQQTNLFDNDFTQSVNNNDPEYAREIVMQEIVASDIDDITATSLLRDVLDTEDLEELERLREEVKQLVEVQTIDLDADDELSLPNPTPVVDQYGAYIIDDNVILNEEAISNLDSRINSILTPAFPTPQGSTSINSNGNTINIYQAILDGMSPVEISSEDRRATLSLNPASQGPTMFTVPNDDNEYTIIYTPSSTYNAIDSIIIEQTDEGLHISSELVNEGAQLQAIFNNILVDVSNQGGSFSFSEPSFNEHGVERGRLSVNNGISAVIPEGITLEEFRQNVNDAGFIGSGSGPQSKIELSFASKDEGYSLVSGSVRDGSAATQLADIRSRSPDDPSIIHFTDNNMISSIVTQPGSETEFGAKMENGMRENYVRDRAHILIDIDTEEDAWTGPHTVAAVMNPSEVINYDLALLDESEGIYVANITFLSKETMYIYRPRHYNVRSTDYGDVVDKVLCFKNCESTLSNNIVNVYVRSDADGIISAGRMENMIIDYAGNWREVFDPSNIFLVKADEYFLLPGEYSSIFNIIDQNSINYVQERDLLTRLDIEAKLDFSERLTREEQRELYYQNAEPASFNNLQDKVNFKNNENGAEGFITIQFFSYINDDVRKLVLNRYMYNNMIAMHQHNDYQSEIPIKTDVTIDGTVHYYIDRDLSIRPYVHGNSITFRSPDEVRDIFGEII